MDSDDEAKLMLASCDAPAKVFVERLVDASFAMVESDAGILPVTINSQSFDYTYFLVDVIYPHYSRFVKAIREPIPEEERCFAAWQELCQKDIERAFGVLKNTWQFMVRPTIMMDLNNIAKRTTTCLISTTCWCLTM
jgi:Plant transposon protein